MKLEQIRVIPYARPGSAELARLMAQRSRTGRGFLLANHGIVVGAADLESAVHQNEEFEETAKLYLHLKLQGAGESISYLTPEQVQELTV